MRKITITALCLLILSQSIAAARYPVVLSHPRPVIYMRHPQVVIPERRGEEVLIDIDILNAGRAQPISIHMDVRYPTKALRLVAVEKPARDVFLSDAAYTPRNFGFGMHESNLRYFKNQLDRGYQPITERILPYEIRTVRAIGKAHAKRWKGTIARLKFRSQLSRADFAKLKDLNPYIQFVRVRIRYADGSERLWLAPNLLPHKENEVLTFSTRLVRRIQLGDLNDDGKSDERDVCLAWNYYGSFFLQRDFHNRTPISVFETLRLADIDRNWIVNTHDGRLLCLTEQGKNPTCNFLFGALKQQAVQ